MAFCKGSGIPSGVVSNGYGSSSPFLSLQARELLRCADSKAEDPNANLGGYGFRSETQTSTSEVKELLIQSKAAF